jgi:DNA-binding response OmpR family regulator
MARILIVENDSNLNDMMSRHLEAGGHKVVSAFDGLEALGKIYSEKFDLAIIDIVLPRIDGALLLKSIKERNTRSMVLIVSAPGEIELAVNSLRHGAFDIIKKPFDEDDFQCSVENALEEWRSMKNSGYIYRDNRRKDRSLIKSGIIHAVTDSILVAAALYIAFLNQDFFFGATVQPLLLGRFELLQLSLGLGFCYAFIFVYKRNHRTDQIDSGKELAVHLWRNLSMSYMIFLAILFLANGVSHRDGRVAVGFGYILGFTFLCANRFLLIPYLSTGTLREGRRRILIAGTDRNAPDTLSQVHHQQVSVDADKSSELTPASQDGRRPGALLITRREDIDEVLMSEQVEELYITGDALSADEIAGLLDRVRSRKLKLVLLKDRAEIHDSSGVESSAT